ncbi:hypothetical protein BDM02DRAFT_3119865 [Thelephora ganbajun]|uniref:Uncharacterized protein n=1 Tax=Thelephora ganbajun TaxID=370292 RepID=A0ACB6Z7Q8_THEGA|nr:hypothetical protein BDM02DRAFT_3119865 [Thelephora ganbajun]
MFSHAIPTPTHGPRRVFGILHRHRSVLDSGALTNLHELTQKTSDSSLIYAVLRVIDHALCVCPSGP